MWCSCGRFLLACTYLQAFYYTLCEADLICIRDANMANTVAHADVIKWKHFPHKGQWRGALMFSLIFAWINGWVNNREAGDWRRYRTHYDVTVMYKCLSIQRWYAISKHIDNDTIRRVSNHFFFFNSMILYPFCWPLYVIQNDGRHSTKSCNTTSVNNVLNNGNNGKPSILKRYFASLCASKRNIILPLAVTDS